jgi:hypothetical protein
MRQMILLVLALLSNASYAFTNYAELTSFLANHPESKIEDVVGAVDPTLADNHVLIYHPGGLLTGSPKFPAVAVTTPLGGTTENAESKDLVTVMYQSNLNQGRSQELEVIEWNASQRAIHMHRVSFDPITKKLARIENDPTRCLVCHGFSNDGNRIRPIWDSYSKNNYSGTYASFPDVLGGGLSFEPRIFQAIRGESHPRMGNISLENFDTASGFASTLYAMNWVSFTTEVTQKIAALPKEKAMTLKADFDRYFQNADADNLLLFDGSYRTFLNNVIARRKSYLREKFSRAISLEGLFATATEKASVAAISDAEQFANADHEAYFEGHGDDLSLIRMIYILRKNGLNLNTFSMSLNSETYSTRSPGTDDHTTYFARTVTRFIDSLSF